MLMTTVRINRRNYTDKKKEETNWEDKTEKKNRKKCDKGNILKRKLKIFQSWNADKTHSDINTLKIVYIRG